MKYFIMFTVFIIALGCSHKAHQKSRTDDSSFLSPIKKCPDDSERQVLRSNELQEIASADQEDRKIPAEKIDWNKVSRADEDRAKRVAEIFAEGCFKTAKDYSAAALVFQHGIVPDHYYQAYLWSKKAVELGDLTQKSMMTNAIDRYLINLGYKQLFGAQYFKNPEGCRCIGETESKFTDKLRIKISGIPFKDRMAFLREGNKDKPACDKVIYCTQGLQTPPRGLLPGIW